MISRNKWCAISTVFICFAFIINVMLTPASQAYSGSESSRDMDAFSNLSPALGDVDMSQDLQRTTTNITPAIKTLLLK